MIMFFAIMDNVSPNIAKTIILYYYEQYIVPCSIDIHRRVVLTFTQIHTRT